MLIVDAQEHLIAVNTRGDILRAVANSETATGVLDAGSQELIVIYPDEFVCTTLDKILSHQIERFPVVNRNDPRQVVGYLGRAELLAARQRLFAEEQNREHGWLMRASRHVRLARILRMRATTSPGTMDRKSRASVAQKKGA